MPVAEDHCIMKLVELSEVSGTCDLAVTLTCLILLGIRETMMEQRSTAPPLV